MSPMAFASSAAFPAPPRDLAKLFPRLARRAVVIRRAVQQIGFVQFSAHHLRRALRGRMEEPAMRATAGRVAD